MKWYFHFKFYSIYLLVILKPVFTCNFLRSLKVKRRPCQTVNKCFLSRFVSLYETLCPIWCDLYNLKNVKNTHGGVLLLVKLQEECYI